MLQKTYFSSLPPAIALIGASGYAATHLRFLLEVVARGECRLVSAVALGDTAPETRAQLEALGVQVYASFESWIENERGRFDLVFLPTPTHLHASMAEAALAAGGSVLLEKPLAASWLEIERLIALRPAEGRFFAIGFQDLYLDEVQALKSALLAGDYGRVRHIRVLGRWPRAHAYYQRNGWAGRLAVDGSAVLDSPVSNAMAHFVMLALFMAGGTQGSAAEVLKGDAELYRARPIESFDTAVMRLETRESVGIHVAMTHSGVTDCAPQIVIETEDAVIDWQVWERWTITRKGGEPVVTELTKMDGIRQNLAARLCARVHDAAGFTCSPKLAAVHAALVLDLHAGCPVHTVEAAWVRQSHVAGGAGNELISIDDVLVQASESGKLPSEMGVKWAQGSHRFSAHYSQRLAQTQFL
jgi:predicted dehydrogenase